jgi:hypothetical protein
MPRKAPKLHIDDVAAPTSPSGKKYVRGPNLPVTDLDNAAVREVGGKKQYMGARKWTPATGDYSQAKSQTKIGKGAEVKQKFSGVRKLPPNNGWGEWSPSYGR